MRNNISVDNDLILAINRFQGGDDTAFQSIYDNSVRYVNYSILMSLQDKELAEDILQDTYLEVYKNLKSLKEPEAFKKWAAVIAHNKISRYYRNNKDTVFSSEEEMETAFDNEEEEKADMLPEDALDNQETQRLILDIINNLPEIQRETVISFYYNQLSISEISEVLGVPENTTKTNLSRGRKKIKEGILELEKKHGTKLYTIPIMAVLSGLFAREAKACELPANGLALVESETGISIAAAAVNGGVYKGTAIAATKTAGIKWILVAVAGLLVVGTSAGMVLSMSNQKKNEKTSVETVTETASEIRVVISEENITDEEVSESIEEILPSEEVRQEEEPSTEPEETEEPEPEIDYNEEYYREMMKDITSEPIAAIRVDDFDGDGINGAFVVTFPDMAYIDAMYEDMEGAFTTSSLYYLEKDDYTEIYEHEQQYSAQLNNMTTKTGVKLLAVGTLSAYAPSRSYDDTLYIVKDHIPICIGKTDGISSVPTNTDAELIGSNIGHGIVDGLDTAVYIVTPYTIENDMIVAGDSYVSEDEEW